MNCTKFTIVTTPCGWDVNQSDSTGLALQAGLDRQLSKHSVLFASVAKIDGTCNLTATGVFVLQSTIDFRPLTYPVGVSFRF